MLLYWFVFAAAMALLAYHAIIWLRKPRISYKDKTILVTGGST